MVACNILHFGIINVAQSFGTMELLSAISGNMTLYFKFIDPINNYVYIERKSENFIIATINCHTTSGESTCNIPPKMAHTHCLTWTAA